MSSNTKITIGAVLNKCESLFDLLNQTKSREDFVPECIGKNN